MPVKLLTSGGGGVNLVPSSSIASDVTVTVPSKSGTTVLTDVADNIGIAAAGANYITMSTNGSERMRIDSSGNVGIGATPTNKLDVQSSGSYSAAVDMTTAQLRLKHTTFPVQLYAGLDHANRFAYMQASETGVGYRDLVVQPAGGNLLVGTTTGSYKLTLNGQPGANGYTAWTNYSDARLKENVTDLTTENVLTKVCSLRPVTFNYNDKSGFDEDTRKRRISGFIAQELQQVFPDMVGTTEINGSEYLDTNLSNFTLYLLQAIKEQQAIIESQAQTIESLTQRIEALEYTKQSE